jgi:hypothetical protein
MKSTGCRTGCHREPHRPATLTAFATDGASAGVPRSGWTARLVFVRSELTFDGLQQSFDALLQSFDALLQNFDAAQQNFVPSEVEPAASVQIATPSDLTRDTAASRFSSLDLDAEIRWPATQYRRSQILFACNKYQLEPNKKDLEASKSQLERIKNELQTSKRQHPRDKKQHAGSRQLLRRSRQESRAVWNERLFATPATARTRS